MLLNLPDDVLSHICSFLRYKDIINLRVVNSLMTFKFDISLRHQIIFCDYDSDVYTTRLTLRGVSVDTVSKGTEYRELYKAIRYFPRMKLIVRCIIESAELLTGIANNILSITFNERQLPMNFSAFKETPEMHFHYCCPNTSSITHLKSLSILYGVDGNWIGQNFIAKPIFVQFELLKNLKKLTLVSNKNIDARTIAHVESLSFCYCYIDNFEALGKKQKYISVDNSVCKDSHGHIITNIAANLGNVYEVKLRSLHSLTNVKELGSVTILNLEYLDNLEDISALGNVTSLKLKNLQKVTDISALGRVHTLYLESCSGIKDISGLGRGNKFVTIVKCPVSNINSLTTVNTFVSYYMPIFDYLPLRNIKNLKIHINKDSYYMAKEGTIDALLQNNNPNPSNSSVISTNDQANSTINNSIIKNVVIEKLYTDTFIYKHGQFPKDIPFYESDIIDRGGYYKLL